MIGIYIITNKVNNKRYIGLSVNIKRRFMEHKSPKNVNNKTTNLCKAFRKYGLSNFNFEVLEIVDCVQNLPDREKYWINKLNPEYNMNEGGLGNVGVVVSEYTRDLIRHKAKQNWIDMSEEKKNKIISNFKKPEFGRKLSEKTKQKIRLANLGKKQSEESNRKRSESNKIKAIGNKNGNKKVIGIGMNGNTIEFDSTKLAADYLNVHPSCITGVIKGRRKTCKGYVWKHKNK